MFKWLQKNWLYIQVHVYKRGRVDYKWIIAWKGDAHFGFLIVAVSRPITAAAIIKGLQTIATSVPRLISFNFNQIPIVQTHAA